MKIGTKAQSCLESNIGLTLEQIRKMSTEEQIKYIEKKSGSKLCYSFSNNNPTKRARGNAVLGEERYRTMEEIDAVLDAAIEKAQREKSRT